VTVTILDAAGQTVRTLVAPRGAGVGRIYWDLRHEPTRPVRLRTSPLYAPDVMVGPDGTRPAPGAGQLSMLALPGTYTVRLTAGGTSLTQKLEVRKDPNAAGTDADLQAQNKMLVELRRDLEQATDAIHTLELMRSQIQNLGRLTADADVRKAGGTLEQKLTDLEMNFIDLRMTGRGQDGVRFGARLHGKLGYLAGGLTSADFQPTSQQGEVQKVLEDQLRRHMSELDNILSREVGTFNDLLRKKNLPIVITR
jgi:hypothetical protein